MVVANMGGRLEWGPLSDRVGAARELAFQGYCYYEYRMVYGTQKGGGGGGVSLRRSRAMLLQQCGNHRWGGNEMMLGSFTQALKQTNIL